MPAKSQIKPRSTAKRTANPPAKVAGRKPAKTGYINARVEPKLKKSAEAVFDKIGLSTTEAVTIFLKQVVAQKGIPFAVNVPNRETIRALRDAEAGRTERFTGSADELFAHILGKKHR
jgi:DNA-damage-inducible protein J|uniref:Addiction module antitoxin, RelB/DinJ family n=1 Tax=Rhodopseudomonas palustris (strain BisA53) TaxID=316055 RepID=Q07RT9_RHOP5